MSLLNVALNLSLNLQWVPGWMTTSFNDSTYFTWNPTTPPVNAVWYGAFDAAGSSMPSKYLGVQVVADGSKWVWQFAYCQLTFTMPAGPVSLAQAMAAVYQSTQRVITADQYQAMTGTPWVAAPLTLGQAMTDLQAQYGAAATFQGLSIIAPGVLLIEA